MKRPVIKHLAGLNFKSWNRLDEAIRGINDRLDSSNECLVILLQLRQTLNWIRNDVMFLDETFREHLEE